MVFELAGFSTVRNEGIRVSLGFTATVNAELKVASLQESVTVTGQSPVVDTSATSIGNTFDAKQLSALPTSRDYFSLLAQSPAVQMNRIDVGGSTNGTQQGYTVYGTSGQVRVIFEGINATENTGAFGNYPDVGGMEEVQMNTAAHSAEASTPGVQTQFISKSGGNQFRGTFFGGYSPESWQAFNIDADQIALGLTGGGGLEPEDVNRLSQYQDMNVGFGGYVIKDRLWWYGSYRHQDIKARFVNFPVMPQQTILNNYSAKVTYNLTTNNKFIGYTQPSQKKQPQRFDSFLLGVDTGLNTADDDLEPELLGVGAQGRVERRAQRQLVRRNPRRPVRLRLDQRRERHRAALRGHRQQPDPRPQPQLGARAAARPGARHLQLLQERLGRRSQLQDRRRDLPRDHHRHLTSMATRKRSCTSLNNGAKLGGHPLPARRRRSAACGPTARSSTTRGASTTG